MLCASLGDVLIQLFATPAMSERSSRISSKTERHPWMRESTKQVNNEFIHWLESGCVLLAVGCRRPNRPDACFQGGPPRGRDPGPSVTTRHHQRAVSGAPSSPARSAADIDYGGSPTPITFRQGSSTLSLLRYGFREGVDEHIAMTLLTKTGKWQYQTFDRTSWRHQSKTLQANSANSHNFRPPLAVDWKRGVRKVRPAPRLAATLPTCPLSPTSGPQGR